MIPVWRQSIRDQWRVIASIYAVVVALTLYRGQFVLALIFGAAVLGTILTARGWARW